MKLLIATHSLAGLAGAPLHTFDLCRGFRRAGHDVSTFAFYTGIVADELKEEGFPLFSLQNYSTLDKEKESFDLVYLHHATCEALLGLMFAGLVPIVRGYIGIYSRNGSPVNGNFSSAATLLSEEARDTFFSIGHHDTSLRTMIARNVYDDQQLDPGAASRRNTFDKPNFVIVSNHVPLELASLLETAMKKGLCRFTHFGHPNNSTPITPGLLAPFDAVITIGRTVLLAVAMGKPVYLCDIRGADGWLVRSNYHGSQRHNFSGRFLANKDWGLIQRQLLDASQWPSDEDVTWLSEQVERDHALSRRVTELEEFFADIIEKAPPPVPVPDGYRPVFNLINEKEQGEKSVPGQRSRRRELAETLKAAEGKLERKSERVRQLERRLQRQREQNRQLGSQLEGRRGFGTTSLFETLRYVWNKVFGRR